MSLLGAFGSNYTLASGTAFSTLSLYNSSPTTTNLQATFRTLEQVAWTGVTNATVSGSSIWKSISGANWDAGAISSVSLNTNNVAVEFKSSVLGLRAMCGFGTGSVTEGDNRTIEHALYCNNDNKLYIYERGDNKTASVIPYTLASVLTVISKDGVVSYCCDTIPFYTSSIAQFGSPIYAQSVMYDQNAGFNNVFFGKTYNASNRKFGIHFSLSPSSISKISSVTLAWSNWGVSGGTVTVPASQLQAGVNFIEGVASNNVDSTTYVTISVQVTSPLNYGEFTLRDFGLDICKLYASDVGILRTKITNERARRGLSTAAWADTTITANVTKIKADHINELRSNLVDGIIPTTWPTGNVTAKTSLIKSEHFSELENLLNFLKSFNGSAFEQIGSGCVSSCTGFCSTTCTGTCANGCTSCSQSCGGTCTSTCGGCTGACSNGCSGCGDGCSGCSGCGAACAYGCGTCTGTCGGDCENKCTSKCTGCTGCDCKCSSTASACNCSGGCGMCGTNCVGDTAKTWTDDRSLAGTYAKSTCRTDCTGKCAGCTNICSNGCTLCTASCGVLCTQACTATC